MVFALSLLLKFSSIEHTVSTEREQVIFVLFITFSLIFLTTNIVSHAFLLINLSASRYKIHAMFSQKKHTLNNM